MRNVVRQSVAKEARSEGGDVNERQGGGGGPGITVHLYIVKNQPQRIQKPNKARSGECKIN